MWSESMTQAIGLVSLIVASLGIATSATILILALIISGDQQVRPYLSRFSIRVLLHFEFVAILAGVANILTLVTTTNNTTCVASAYLQALLVNVLNSLASLITINFFLVLCLNVRSLRSTYCIPAVWIICLAFTTPALGLGYFGLDPEQGVCWIVIPASQKRYVIEAISSWTVCLTCAALSIISAALVLLKLQQRSRHIGQFGLTRDNDLAERHKKKIILKILVFPMLVLIIDGIVIGATISSDFVSVPYWISFVSQVLLNCPGLAVGIAIFFVDPSFKRALRLRFRKNRTVLGQKKLRLSDASDPESSTPSRLSSKERVVESTSWYSSEPSSAGPEEDQLDYVDPRF